MEINQDCDITGTWVQTWSKSLVPSSFSSKYSITTLILRINRDWLHSSDSFLSFIFLKEQRWKPMKKRKSYQELPRKAFMENTPCIQNPPPPSHTHKDRRKSGVHCMVEDVMKMPHGCHCLLSHFSMSWYLLQRSEQNFKGEAVPTLSFIEIVVDFYMQTHLNCYLNLNSYAGKMCGI